MNKNQATEVTTRVIPKINPLYFDLLRDPERLEKIKKETGNDNILEYIKRSKLIRVNDDETTEWDVPSIILETDDEFKKTIDEFPTHFVDPDSRPKFSLLQRIKMGLLPDPRKLNIEYSDNNAISEDTEELTAKTWVKVDKRNFVTELNPMYILAKYSPVYFKRLQSIMGDNVLERLKQSTRDPKNHNVWNVPNSDELVEGVFVCDIENDEIIE